MTGTTISKSDYLKYRDCPSSFWFHIHAPHLLAPEKSDPYVDRLKSQGYLVERCARKLFPEATLVQGKPAEAATLTQQLLAEGGTQLLQASFRVDGPSEEHSLFASCDILVYNALLDAWDIIEVKSSTAKTKKEEKHLLDAAFQRMVVQKAGLRVANVYLMELDRDYLKQGDIDVEALFVSSEITTECIDLETQVLLELYEASQLLTQPQPTECSCRYKGRSRHCQAFSHIYPEVPAYSVYDLRAIGRSKRTLKTLVDGGHLRLDEIPSEVRLNDKHAKQVRVAVTQEALLDRAAIGRQLEDLEFPLYFLDYETLACGVPVYDLTYPHQQTVFQYSLHIMHADGQIEHREYIHPDTSTPVHVIASKLREDIGDKGQVIVWNRGFEGKCNVDLANLNPENAAFLNGLNERTFDLMKIFERMECLHDGFQGRYSIKKVLPVLCPELDYNQLEVSNGTQAVVTYEALIFGEVDASVREQMLQDLLAYCKLDTWAMVRIYQELVGMVETPVLLQPV